MVSREVLLSGMCPVLAMGIICEDVLVAVILHYSLSLAQTAVEKQLTKHQKGQCLCAYLMAIYQL